MTKLMPWAAGFMLVGILVYIGHWGWAIVVLILMTFGS